MQETEEFLKGLTRGISNTIRLAYERGVKDGEERREAKALKNMAEYSQSRFQDGYERGLNDAWEVARRIEKHSGKWGIDVRTNRRDVWEILVNMWHFQPVWCA